MSTQYSLFRDYRGLPPSLYLELASHMTRQIESIPESVIELYSAISRPGSWEWQTEDGHDVRRILKEKGYETIEDPKASWRVRWQQKEVEDSKDFIMSVGELQDAISWLLEGESK